MKRALNEKLRKESSLGRSIHAEIITWVKLAADTAPVVIGVIDGELSWVVDCWAPFVTVPDLFHPMILCSPVKVSLCFTICVFQWTGCTKHCTETNEEVCPGLAMTSGPSTFFTLTDGVGGCSELPCYDVLVGLIWSRHIEAKDNLMHALEGSTLWQHVLPESWVERQIFACIQLVWIIKEDRLAVKFFVELCRHSSIVVIPGQLEWTSAVVLLPRYRCKDWPIGFVTWSTSIAIYTAWTPHVLQTIRNIICMGEEGGQLDLARVEEVSLLS
jgi:hypothetical protein